MMKRIGMIGDRHGFSQIGGLRTLAHLMQDRLKELGHEPLVLKANSSFPPDLASLVLLGCSSPWAHGMAIAWRLRHPSRPVVRIPCFHPPQYVRHPKKAVVARLALRLGQRIGIGVCTLSEAERQQLEAGCCSLISLPFTVAGNLRDSTSERGRSRRYDLIFLGRPVEQKGWPRFLELTKRTRRPCLALISTPARGDIPTNLEVVVGAKEDRVHQGLCDAKVLLLPADYESFGFAQAEALLQGCCVPVLGEWPLWLDVPELDWRGVGLAEQATRLEKLLAHEQDRQALVEAQRLAWQKRPERSAPCLPPLLLGDA